jgi:hypothetical protein
VVVCDYSDNILGVGLKDQMLHLYLASCIGHSRIKRNIDSLNFMLSLAQGLVEEHSSGVLCTVRGHPSTELLHIPSARKKAKPNRK